MRFHHRHQWRELRRTFTGSGAVKSLTNIDPRTAERLVFGVTVVEQRCSECGRQRSYEVIGKAMG